MISVFDLQQVITKWQNRASSPAQPFAYKTGISECIFELNQLIDHSVEEELTYQEFLDQEADRYLSSVEAHEAVA